MTPLTKIETNSCEWLGYLLLACAVAGELLALATNCRGLGTTFVGREIVRRALRHDTFRSR